MNQIELIAYWQEYIDNGITFSAPDHSRAAKETITLLKTLDAVKSDRFILASRLECESFHSFAPETYEVMMRMRPILYEAWGRK